MKPLIVAAMAAFFAHGAAAAEYGTPRELVPASPFHGVHGLAVDARGRLLAGSVVGNSIWQVDRKTGKASEFVGGPLGQADDIAIGPNGEMAWTSYLQGVLRMRASDDGEIVDVAKGLPGINSLAFDQSNGKLYGSQVFLGDALYEFDRNGGKPRLIAKDMGGFNGFEVGKDGMLYGPLWFKGQVARIDPADGKITVVADGFAIPAAVNFDSRGMLWVVDTKRGELVEVDPKTGNKGRVVKLATSLDNLAIGKDDAIFVSNMADHSIVEVDGKTGATRTIVAGKASVPAGLKLSEDGKTVYFADIFALRSVDTETGKVTDIRRMQASDLEYPFSVGLTSKHLLATSWFTGSVQVIDRASMKTLGWVHKLKAPTDALELPDGSILVCEIATGNIVRAHGDKWHEMAPVVSGLKGPVQMIMGKDGMVYVTEAAGTVTRVNPKDWSTATVAKGLALPEGIAQAPDGRLIVAEAAAKRLTAIDIATGKTEVLVENLPIGLAASPGMPPSYVITGVDVDKDGVIYVSADINNAIYRIAPK